MRSISRTIQVVVSIILALLILLQQKGTGLGAIGGASENEFYATKRGAEKVIFNLTVIMATLFCLNALVFPFLPEE